MSDFNFKKATILEVHPTEECSVFIKKAHAYSLNERVKWFEKMIGMMITKKGNRL